MYLSRPGTLRAALRHQTIRASRNSTRLHPWRLSGRRGYASGGHEPKKASSDLPWLLGAVAVTVPTCGYLLSPGSDAGHGHGGHESDHGANDGSEEGEAHDGGQEEASADTKEGAAESSDQTNEEGEDSSEGAEGDSTGGAQQETEKAGSDSDNDEGSSGSSDNETANGQNTPDTSDDESSEGSTGSGVSGVRFKGATKGGPPADERLHIPDAKGDAKRRINSSYGNRQGVLDPSGEPDDGPEDRAASSKSPGSRHTQSGKQEGLTNTDTKHSTDIANDPSKSKKGEGMPETAKSKGTVSHNRPQV
ncbi:MAG: hypothetical protein M1837_001653 [Sclerophora amabilis]|nr:MAG: hypothetical protein M1837_001653 [Sclerophora amabilis]